MTRHNGLGEKNTRTRLLPDRQIAKGVWPGVRPRKTRDTRQINQTDEALSTPEVLNQAVSPVAAPLSRGGDVDMAISSLPTRCPGGDRGRSYSVRSLNRERFHSGYGRRENTAKKQAPSGV